MSARNLPPYAGLLLGLVCACNSEAPVDTSPWLAFGRGGSAGTRGVGGSGNASRPIATSSGSAGAGDAELVEDFVQLAAGPRFSCARLLDGRVKCWGQNGGWLGLGDYLDRGDEPGEMGAALPAVDLGNGQHALRIATRDSTVCALLRTHAVKCWGNNSKGELGQGDTMPRGGHPNEMGDGLRTIDLGPRGAVAEIAVGGNHVCARFDSGAVACWGSNDFGELGVGDPRSRGDEPGELGQAVLTVDLGKDRRALQITAGEHHNCALLDDHNVKCWGQNSFGQLGLGDNLARGDEPGELGDALANVNLGNGQLVRAVHAGSDFNCAILADQRVKCWGNNASMQLGNGTTDLRGDSPLQLGDALPFTDLGPEFRAKTLALGREHACALSTNGAVKCWGNNSDGRLGLGDTEERGAPMETMGGALAAVEFGNARRAYSIAVGGTHSCAALDDGTVTCWGNNDAGQLGLGDRAARGTTPTDLGERTMSIALD